MTKKLIIITFCLVAISSCANLRKKSQTLKNGMSKSDVVAKFGEPDDVQFNGDKSALTWCSTGFYSDEYVVGWFEEDKLFSVTTYTRHLDGLCSGAIRQIDWSE
jgi:hypothetical protein